MFNSLSTSKFIQDKVQKIAEKGIQISIKYDFEELYALQGKLGGKEISPLFDLKYFDLLPENAFWLEGRDEDDEIVHIQAMKLMDHGQRSSLADLLKQQLRRAFNSDVNLDQHQFCPAAQNLKGKIAYQGEMWLSTKCRGSKIGEPLGLLGLMMIYSHWDPDHVYAFIEGPFCRTGVPFTQGYWNFQPLNCEWQMAHPWLYQEDWLIWMSRQDLDYLLHIDHQTSGRKRRLSDPIPSKIQVEKQNDNTKQV